MDIPFFNAQAQVLLRIASWRTDALDPIFRFLNYFDSEYFLIALIPFVWLAVSRRWGLRLAYLLIFNAFFNAVLKFLLGSSRPEVAFPGLPMIHIHSPGCPSGAAQMAVLLGGFLVYRWRSAWAWPIALIYVGLISFSRLYLGVHYPSDLIVGWVVGAVVIFFYIGFGSYIERFLVKQGRHFCIIFACAVSVLYFLIVPAGLAYQLGGAFLGFSIGAYFTSLFHIPVLKIRSISNRVVVGILAILSVSLLYLITPVSIFPEPLQAFLIALWISFGANLFCKRAFVFLK